MAAIGGMTAGVQMTIRKPLQLHTGVDTVMSTPARTKVDLKQEAFSVPAFRPDLDICQ